MFNKPVFQIALTWLGICAAFGQDTDRLDLTNARVTIPYSELKELWKAAQQNNQPLPAKPPVAAELLSARYEIELKGDQVTGFVEFEAQSFSADWTLLPLIGRDTQVHKIEPAKANIILRDEAYALLTNRPARQQIRMHFAANLLQEGEGRRLQIANAPALVNLLTVRGIPADKTLHIPHASQIAQEKGVSTWRVASQQGLELQLLAASKAAPVPSQWQTTAQCLANFGDDVLRYDAHVTATTTAGSALGLNLKLPPAARVVSVSSDDLAAWRSDDSSPQVRRVGLQWRTPGIMNRQIDITYEMPQTMETEWQLRAPEAENGTTLAPIFALTAGNEIELKPAGDVPTATQPPRWLAERIAGLANTLVTRSDKVVAKSLHVIEVAPAIVDHAQFATRIVADGSLISEQTYSIRTQAAVVWSIELPANSELLSCTVDDRRTNPINRGTGALEIPIAPGPDGKTTQVALAYTSKAPRFQPVSGSFKVELPKTPLLISSLHWDLAIPAEYELAALEGNVTATTGAPGREGCTVVRVKKELCRNERPVIELFYQKPEVKK
jgi:hypothetical protein